MKIINVGNHVMCILTLRGCSGLLELVITIYCNYEVHARSVAYWPVTNHFGSWISYIIIIESVLHSDLWAACCTCFVGFLHSGEASHDAEGHFSEGDVTLDSVTKPLVVQFQIKTLKTDPFWKGVTVSVYLGKLTMTGIDSVHGCEGQSPGSGSRVEHHSHGNS